MNHWFSKPLQWVQEQSFCAACLNSVHVHYSKFILKKRKVLISWLEMAAYNVTLGACVTHLFMNHNINFLKPNNGHFVYLRWKCASLEKQTLFNKSWLTSHSVNAILCWLLLAVNLSNAVIFYGYKCIHFFKIYTLQRLSRNLMFCCCFSFYFTGLLSDNSLTTSTSLYGVRAQQWSSRVGGPWAALPPKLYSSF